MTHSLKGRKQSPEHVAKRMAAVRQAMKRPSVKAKMTGRPTSAETRAKIGAANKGRYVGRKLSAETKARMGAGQKARWEKYRVNPDLVVERNKKISKSLKGKYTGENASRWKGGLTQGKRESRERWQWRELILQRDDYTCKICDQRGGILHVDHIKSWADYPALRFDLDNGRTLCRPCHYYVTFKKKLPPGSRWGLTRRLQRHSLKDLS